MAFFNTISSWKYSVFFFFFLFFVVPILEICLIRHGSLTHIFPNLKLIKSVLQFMLMQKLPKEALAVSSAVALFVRFYNHVCLFTFSG